MIHWTVRRSVLLLALVGVVLAALPCTSGEDGTEYTQYNIWFEKPMKVYSTNYQRGTMLPAGSAVKDVKVISRGSRKYVEFTVAESGLRIRVYWIRKHDAYGSFEAFRKRLLGTKNFAALVDGLSAAEVAAIREGSIEPGMSKKAVLVSVGYPPSRATATLDLPSWRYWESRFDTIEVRFEGDIVASILD
ncbi:MAG: hypothetical protein Q9Q40_13545 [Acidobacteriota bacterium]|nr:hypothetical protein [Acidobacteriota bacterium]